MTRRSTHVPTSARSGRRIRRLLLAAALGVLAPAAVGLADAPPAGAAGCGPAPAGKVAVWVVIDTGTGTPSQRCVIRVEDDTGWDALLATGLHVREEGGFICGIGGLPATGCARNQSPDVDSWWYWHGTPGGGWTYSTVGAPWYRLPKRCAVEGWRYGSPQGGRDMRVAPPGVECELPARPPATAPPATPAPATPPSGAPGGGAAATGPPSSDRPGGAPGDAEGAPAQGAPPADATTTSVDGTVTPPADADPDAQVESGAAGRDEGASAAEGALGLQTAEEAASSGGGSWVGAGALLGVIAVVGGGAVLRNRRRG